MKVRLSLAGMILTACSTAASATPPEQYFVATDEVKERLGPSAQAKATNTLYKRQQLEVLEVKGGWARVSKFYDGQFEGVVGSVARWVPLSSLSKTKPAEPKVDGSPIAQALKHSNNFEKHQRTFISASEKLIADGTCKLKDFRDAGGWAKSSTMAPRQVYFVYCGGMEKSNRIYLDVSDGSIFRK